MYRVLLEPDAFGKAIGKVWYRLKQWQKVALTVAVALLQVVGGLVVKKYIDPAGLLSRDFLLPYGKDGACRFPTSLPSPCFRSRT